MHQVLRLAFQESLLESSRWDRGPVDAAAPPVPGSGSPRAGPGVQPACPGIPGSHPGLELSILSLLVPRTVCSQQAARAGGGAWVWPSPYLGPRGGGSQGRGPAVDPRTQTPVLNLCGGLGGLLPACLPPTVLPCKCGLDSPHLGLCPSVCLWDFGTHLNSGSVLLRLCGLGQLTSPL